MYAGVGVWDTETSGERKVRKGWSMGSTGDPMGGTMDMKGWKAAKSRHVEMESRQTGSVGTE